MKTNRKEQLMPNGTPRYIRCYDNEGKTFDRYTVVFTGHYKKSQFLHVGMSENPFNPQGFGQHGESDNLIDKPRYSHLGKKIKFEHLSTDCQKLVLQDYCDIWEIDGSQPV